MSDRYVRGYYCWSCGWKAPTKPITLVTGAVNRQCKMCDELIVGQPHMPATKGDLVAAVRYVVHLLKRKKQ